MKLNKFDGVWNSANTLFELVVIQKFCYHMATWHNDFSSHCKLLRTVYHELLRITEYHVWQKAAAALKWKWFTANPYQPLLVVTKTTTQICQYLLIKKTMNTEKTFCINQQLIQLDFIADFYFLKCYETFAHTI